MNIYKWGPRFKSPFYEEFLHHHERCETETSDTKHFKLAQSKSGALNKARALQFCLEEDKNILKDDDWIVHLDEETLLTKGAVRGILNFINNGKHSFGQGRFT